MGSLGLRDGDAMLAFGLRLASILGRIGYRILVAFALRIDQVVLGVGHFLLRTALRVRQILLSIRLSIRNVAAHFTR